MMLACCCTSDAAPDDGIAVAKHTSVYAVGEEEEVELPRAPAAAEPAGTTSEEAEAAAAAAPEAEQAEQAAAVAAAGAPPKSSSGGEEEPQGSAESFEVELNNSQPLGLELDSKFAGIHILAIDGGAATEYNTTAADKVEPNMFITSVNGKTDSTDMIQELKTKELLRLRVTRPTVFTVNVNKGSRPMGGKVKYNQWASAYMEVVEAGEGTPLAESSIRPGDCIASVNGVSGRVADMCTEIAAKDQVVLTCVRLRT